MTVIQARCPMGCENRLAPEHILLTSADYSFWCSDCGTHVIKDATAAAVTLLLYGGVVLSNVAPEYAQHDGPALTDDDLDVFLTAMRKVDWVVVQAGDDVHRIPTADAGGAS